MIESITLGQVRALNEVANATKAALRTKDRAQVAALARLNVALEVCMGLDIHEEAQSIADQAGITPVLIDRLTDRDVWAVSERMIAEAVPNGA
jgi:hypothetical protein